MKKENIYKNLKYRHLIYIIQYILFPWSDFWSIFEEGSFFIRCLVFGAMLLSIYLMAFGTIIVSVYSFLFIKIKLLILSFNRNKLIIDYWMFVEKTSNIDKVGLPEIYSRYKLLTNKKILNNNFLNIKAIKKSIRYNFYIDLILFTFLSMFLYLFFTGIIMKESYFFYKVMILIYLMPMLLFFSLEFFHYLLSILFLRENYEKYGFKEVEDSDCTDILYN